MIERRMVTRQGSDTGIGGSNRLCTAATGHSLVALSSLSVSIKDVCCCGW
jgi:hypothetical protein